MSIKRREIARIENLLIRKVLIDAFCFLKADNVGVGVLKPAEQVRHSRVDRIDVPGGDLHLIAVDPIIWLSMLMCDCEDQYVIVFDRIKEFIRKPVKQTFPHFAALDLPCSRMTRDPLGCQLHLSFKGNAQSFKLEFKIVRGAL